MERLWDALETNILVTLKLLMVTGQGDSSGGGWAHCQTQGRGAATENLYLHSRQSAGSHHTNPGKAGRVDKEAYF